MIGKKARTLLAKLALVGMIAMSVPGVSMAAEETSTQTTQTAAATTKLGLQLGRTNNMQASVAQFLGMDTSTLQTERRNGKSLSEIALSKGKSEQALVDYIITQRTARLNQLVAEGRITQAQADSVQQQMQQRISNNVKQTNVGLKGQGKGKGRGKMLNCGNGGKGPGHGGKGAGRGGR